MVKAGLILINILVFILNLERLKITGDCPAPIKH